MTRNSLMSLSYAGPYYSYNQHFQVAVHNLDKVIREERLLKRVRKSKTNIHSHE